MSETGSNGPDPRLEIPEVLRTPVRKPVSIERAAGTGGLDGPGIGSDTAGMAKGWAIALSFMYSVAGGALLGWAVEQWIFPSWKPWALLGGLTAGLIAGFVRFVREALKANRG